MIGDSFYIKIAPSPVVPRQHGAWSVLAASFVAGAFAGLGSGGRAGPALAAFALAAVAGFLARHSISIYIRSGVAIGFAILWTFIAAVASLLMILRYELNLMLPLCGIFFVVFAISLFLERQRLDRGVAGEIINMCGLSVVAPVSAYAMTGVLNIGSAGLWALCALYFSGSVFHVRYIAARREMKAAYSATYHLAAIAAALVICAAGALPKFAALALIPAALRAIIPAIRKGERPSLRRIGFMELAHTAIFVGIIAVVFGK